MLRALQVGLRLTDLENITVGDLMDLLIESSNDSYDYPQVATKEDFARF